jgi:hypothetical protein
MSALIPYNPTDVEEAHEVWGANCGPCAFAAVLRMPVMAVRSCFEGFEQRHYVNPTHMKQALSRVQIPFSIRRRRWPFFGLSFVQWDGPWCAPDIPVTVAYRYTHWIGVDGSRHRHALIYDVNSGRWTSFAYWESEVKPIIAHSIPRATGAYFIRTSFELER